MEKIPHCWQHLPMVWHGLKVARNRMSNLATKLLEIPDAYGSMPHKLILFTLLRYVVSPQWVRYIET